MLVASQEPYWAGASERALMTGLGQVPSMMTIHIGVIRPVMPENFILCHQIGLIQQALSALMNS